MRKNRCWLGVGLAVIALSGRVYGKDLGDILLKKGLITQDDLNQAREEDKQKSAAEESKRDAIVAKLPKWLDMITPFGDFRGRFEGFYQDHRIAENRERIRARIGLTANVSDEISTQFRLATGDTSNPVTRNQTLNSTFSQKQIQLDQAFMTLKPGKTVGLEPGWITITGGKFSTNAYRVSELVWDDDLTPEGATESVNLYQQREGILRGLTLNAFQWVVDEIATSDDPWMGGGQGVMETALGSSALMTTALADYNYSGLNSVARKYLSPSSSSQNKTLATTNRLQVVRDPMTGKVTSINGFTSHFNEVEALTEVDFPPIVLPIPVGVFGDVVYNTEAQSRNVGAYVGAGFGSAGRDYYHDTLKNKGDWGVSYTYVWVEQDSALALFNYDDISYSQGTFSSTQTGSNVTGGTNVTGHIVRFDYMPITNFQLTWKTHFINALDTSLNQSENVVKWNGNPTLVRMQVDAMVKF